MTLLEQQSVVTGMFLHHLATDTTFRVLCNCPSSNPRHYTQRHVTQHRDNYRLPTSDEVALVLAPVRKRV